LTDTEKSAFRALCNEFQLKNVELNRPLREEMRKLNEARKGGQAAAEADYKKIVDLRVQVKLQEAQLEQEYTAKFLKVISAEKVFLYQKAEQQFGQNIFKSGRDRDADRASRTIDRENKKIDRANKQIDRSKKQIDSAKKKQS
jgi:hypothetical protein